jgi:hypothetical protein
VDFFTWRVRGSVDCFSLVAPTLNLKTIRRRINILPKKTHKLIKQNHLWRAPPSSSSEEIVAASSFFFFSKVAVDDPPWGLALELDGVLGALCFFCSGSASASYAFSSSSDSSAGIRKLGPSSVSGRFSICKY